MRCFRGPGGVGGEFGSLGGPNSVRGDWPLWSPVICRGLPCPPWQSHIFQNNMFILDELNISNEGIIFSKYIVNLLKNKF